MRSGLHVGDTIEILYDEENPNNIAMEGDSLRYKLNAIFPIIMGIIVALIGALEAFFLGGIGLLIMEIDPGYRIWELKEKWKGRKSKKKANKSGDNQAKF